MTNDQIKHQIQNVYAKFVSDVEPSRLSDWLVQEGVISTEQWERIRRENPTTQDRCRALLHHLFAIQHPRAFLVVWKALCDLNHYILEFIDNEGSGYRIREQPNVETSSQAETKLQQLEKEREDQARAWEAEKCSLLKLQNELESKHQVDKKKIQQLTEDNEIQNRAWQKEKDRLLTKANELERKHLNSSEKIYQERKLWFKEKTDLLQKNQELQQLLDKQKLQLEKAKDDQQRACESEKDRLLQIQNKHQDQNRAWEAEKDRLLKIQKELETNLHLGKSNEIELLTTERKEYIPFIDQELTATKTDKLRYTSVQMIKTKAAKDANKFIYGFTILDKELFVVREKSSEVEVYNSIKFTFNRRLNLKELVYPTDIGSCSINKCLYINDYTGPGHSNEILRINSRGELIKRWSTGDDRGEGMSVTNESSVILTVYEKNKLNEYSPDGQLVREVNLSSHAGILHPRHAIKLPSGFFVVSYGCSADDLHGVCIVDANGMLKKSFGGNRGSNIGQMDCPIHMSLYDNGFVMVVDHQNSRLLLLDSDLGYKREILPTAEENRLVNPFKILLDESNGRVLVADNKWDSEKRILTEGRILIFDLW